MRVWIPILILVLAVAGLCVWDGVYTTQVFNKMEKETNEIYTRLNNDEFLELSDKISEVNNYWTEKMDILAISISRKDLQPVSDYLQYLRASIINESKEDAITYSLLLKYNVEGLKESTGISLVNLI